MNLPSNITHVTVTHRWWATPPVWHSFVTRVDDNFQRLQQFTAEAPDPSTALEAALASAASYTFAPVTPARDLGLDLDLFL